MDLKSQIQRKIDASLSKTEESPELFTVKMVDATKKLSDEWILDWVECVLGNIKETINRTARFTNDIDIINAPVPPKGPAHRGHQTFPVKFTRGSK